MYEHAFEATLHVVINIPSEHRSRRKVTRAEIMKRLSEIILAWDSKSDVEEHVEGQFDYVESNVVLTESQRRARAGIISAGDHFHSDDEENA